MPTSAAHVPTSRAGRYLDQLCEHLDQMAHGPDARAHSAHGVDGERNGATHGGQEGQREPEGQTGDGGPPAVRRIDRKGSQARVEFDWGTCDLTATADQLTVHVSAGSADELARGQHLMQRRIETIGRRDQLMVTWVSSA